jgi:hypothetical protein
MPLYLKKKDPRVALVRWLKFDEELATVLGRSTCPRLRDLIGGCEKDDALVPVYAWEITSLCPSCFGKSSLELFRVSHGLTAILPE